MKNTLQLSIRNFPNLKSTMPLPMSTVSHLQEQYRTAVTKSNTILQRLAEAERSTAHPVFSDLRTLKTTLQPILATVKSHEILLTHLGGETKRPQRMLAERFVQEFGGYEGFVHEITASAIASRGWVALSYDLDLQRLMVVIGDTAEQLTVWNNAPILVFEVSAATAALDFAGDRRRYVAALLDSVDWAIAERNLEDAIGLQPAGKPF
jgi:superoxide dismutase